MNKLYISLQKYKLLSFIHIHTFIQIDPKLKGNRNCPIINAVTKDFFCNVYSKKKH